MSFCSFVLLLCSDDDTDIHKHLSFLARETQQKEQLARGRDTVTLAVQENPLTLTVAVDLESGPGALDESPRGRGRSHSRVLSVSHAWRLDLEEHNYEQELEKELEIKIDEDEDEDDMSPQTIRYHSEMSSCSVADALLLRQASEAGDEEVGGEAGGGLQKQKQDRLQRLLGRLQSHVHKSQGAGGKPFLILTDAGEQRVVMAAECACLCFCVTYM